MEVANADASVFLVLSGGFLQRGGRCWMVQHPQRVDLRNPHRVVSPSYAACHPGESAFWIEDVVTGVRHLVVLD